MPPYIIRISSQKGGVGKTTIAVNLAVSLQLMGYDTLLVDADTSNPSVGFHLGFEKANTGYSNFVRGKVNDIRSVTVTHAPSGLHVIPGSINSKSFLPTESMAKKAFGQFRKTDYQFIILDTQPGYTELTRYADAALLITTPDMPSCTSVIRLSRALDKMEVRHNLVVNRIRNRKYEIHPREIAQMYDGKIIALLPEDEVVPISVEEQIPAYMLQGRSGFSQNMKKIGKEYGMGLETRADGDVNMIKPHLVRRIINLFRRRK